MRAARFLVLACLSLTTVARAQPEGPPPTGPADIMRRATEGRARGEVKRAAQAGETAAQQAQAPGAAPVPVAPAPQAPHDHAHDPHTALGPPAMAAAEPAADLPTGSIAIEVLDPSGQPFPKPEIVLGVMGGMGNRTEQRAQGGADGRHVFEKLAVGTQQAYRVNVLYGGAKFSSTPFRLPEQGGYRVRILLLPTTTDQSMVFQVIGQTVVELRDDRLHITQQVRLANAGENVYVLPKDGLVVALPPGFTAFDWQEQMTDQRGEERKGEGFALRGSLPPGTVTLAWAFDLPREGTTAKIPVSIPFRTFTYRVISEAPQGLTLKVPGFPEPERVKDEGRDLFFTQVQRTPQDPQLKALSIKLEGIPGPGPGRWIASALALFAVLVGLSRAFKRADDGTDRKALIATRKSELLVQAKSAEAELARGEIGPEFKARRMDEIITELALLLRDEEALGKKS